MTLHKRIQRPNKLKEMAETRGVSVRELVIEALEKGESVSGAARYLDVADNTVKNAMRQHGIKSATRRVIEIEVA